LLAEPTPDQKGRPAVTISPRVIWYTVTGVALTLGFAWMVKAAAPPIAKGPDAAELAKAREQAKMMHAVYASTLDAMHHHFFRRERSVLPARALEDVFEEMERQSKVKARWISVNTRAMSVHHEPNSEFEKEAARALAAGKGEFEQVEGGYYRRAGAIPLAASCVGCHAGLFARETKTPRFAGLVISIPLSRK
jgi:hypothetical protein